MNTNSQKSMSMEGILGCLSLEMLFSVGDALRLVAGVAVFIGI